MHFYFSAVEIPLEGHAWAAWLLGRNRLASRAGRGVIQYACRCRVYIKLTLATARSRDIRKSRGGMCGATTAERTLKEFYVKGVVQGRTETALQRQAYRQLFSEWFNGKAHYFKVFIKGECPF